MADGWYTQTITVGPGVFRSGTNRLTIDAAPHTTSNPDDLFDDFTVRDIVCFFKEAVAAA